MSYDAILFDFDGVLMDSEPVHYDCWKEALKPLGIDIEWESYRQHCIGASEPATMEYYSRLGDPPFDPDEIRAQYPLKQELFRSRMERDLPFAPGIAEFLRSLNGSYALGVVSSSSRSELVPLLARGGILDCFGTLVFGDDVERHKPAPDPYLLAAQRLRAHSPLVVEDSEAGLESARRAGMDAVRIPEAHHTVELVRQSLVRPG